MPLYKYSCECGEQFEELHSVADRHTSICPKCGASAKQEITAVHFDGRMGLDPDFTTFADKWARKRVQRSKVESKRVDN